MYGVVLWTDQRENRAVIWCEDHGDLAFYRGAAGGDAAMAAGDLVEFDIRDSGDLRIADMPRLVTRRSHPNLISELKKAATPSGVKQDEKRDAATSRRPANVISFSKIRHATYA